MQLLYHVVKTLEIKTIRWYNCGEELPEQSEFSVFIQIFKSCTGGCFLCGYSKTNLQQSRFPGMTFTEFIVFSKRNLLVAIKRIIRTCYLLCSSPGRQQVTDNRHGLEIDINSCSSDWQYFCSSHSQPILSPNRAKVWIVLTNSDFLCPDTLNSIHQKQCVEFIR